MSDKVRVFDTKQISQELVYKSQQAATRSLEQADPRDSMHWAQTSLTLAQAAAQIRGL